MEALLTNHAKLLFGSIVAAVLQASHDTVAEGELL